MKWTITSGDVQVEEIGVEDGLDDSGDNGDGVEEVLSVVPE